VHSRAKLVLRQEKKGWELILADVEFHNLLIRRKFLRQVWIMYHRKRQHLLKRLLKLLPRLQGNHDDNASVSGKCGVYD